MIKFSVIVPLYNKEEFVSTALDSVMAQSRQDFEIVVVDDGSSDGGAEVVEKRYGAKIKLIRQENLGVSAARNKGIAEASGEFICFLDADDYWMPDYLSEVDKLFNTYPCAMFVGTSYFEFSSFRGKTAYAGPKIINDAGDDFSLVEAFYGVWTKHSFVYTSSIAIRRCVLERMEKHFEIGVSASEDQDLWFRLAEMSPIGFSKKKLVAYRRDVCGSLSSGLVLDPLHAYRMLRDRIDKKLVPIHLVADGRILVEKHQVDLAIANSIKGKKRSAIRYIRGVRCWLFKAKIIKLVFILLLPSCATLWVRRLYKNMISGFLMRGGRLTAIK